MSTVTDDTEPSDADQGGHAHEHPSDFQYVKIALLLGVITAIEVATYFTGLNNGIIASLYVMMIAKFTVVVSYFMHLKYDSTLFRWVFVGGLLLAIGVYLVAFNAFGFFFGDYP